MAADGTIDLALWEGNALVEIKGNAIRVVVNRSGRRLRTSVTGIKPRLLILLRSGRKCDRIYHHVKSEP